MIEINEIIRRFKEAEKDKINPFFEWEREDVFQRLIKDILINLGYNPDDINYENSEGIAKLEIKGSPKVILYISSLQRNERFLSNRKCAPIDTLPDPETGEPKYEIAVVTNFEKWFFYYNGKEIYAVSIERFEKEYDTITQLISKDSIETGRFAEIAKKLLYRDDNEPLRQELNLLREKIANEILQEKTNVYYLKTSDGSYNNEILNEITTRWITRFLALKLAEDSEINFNFTLKDIMRSFELRGKVAKPVPNAKIKEETLSNAIRALMNEFERRYNGGIFMYQENVDYITIPDKAFFDLLDFATSWAFTIEDTRIIGFVYERFLGQEIVIDEKNGKPSAVLKNIAEARGRRRAGGIYYTPKYIVDYIVDNTLGEILKEKEKEIRNAVENVNCEKFLSILKEVKNLKVLDPACGSGSFLIKVLAEFKNFYEEIKEKAKEIKKKIDDLKREKTKGQKLFTEDKEVSELLTQYSLIEKEIGEIKFPGVFALRHNIYGVDIDPKAIDITAFTLMVQVYDELKEGAKCPTMIGENLKVGNSLVSVITPEERNGFVSRKELERYKEEIKEIIRLRKIEKGIDILEEDELKTLIKENFDDIMKIYSHIKEKYPNAIPTSQQKLLDEWQKRARDEPIEKTFDVLIRQTGLVRVFLKEIYFERIRKIKEIIENEINKPLIKYFNSEKRVLKDEELEEILADNKRVEEEFKFLKERATEISVSQPPKVFNWELEFPEVFFNEDGTLKENPGFDCIVGNPPYGNLLESVEKELIESTFDVYSGEIAGLFVEKGINMIKEKGSYGNLITFAITFHLDLSSLREKLKKNFYEIKIATFDRDPVGIFEKRSMSQSVSILLCNKKIKDINGRILTSRFIRTTEEIKNNISEVLKNLEYEDTEGLLLGEKIGASINLPHRLPKIGDKTAKNILKKLKYLSLNSKILGDLLSDTGEKLWVRVTGNYWYNAFDKKPYEGEAIRELILKNEMTRNLAIIIINSSLFYFYSRIYSDGHNLPPEFLKTFPIPFLEKIKKYEEEIEHAKNKIMMCLFNNFQPQQRRFQTSRCKKIIDELDYLLGKLYDLTDEEIEYIINYDDCIRNREVEEEETRNN